MGIGDVKVVLKLGEGGNSGGSYVGEHKVSGEICKVNFYMHIYICNINGTLVAGMFWTMASNNGATAKGLLAASCEGN